MSGGLEEAGAFASAPRAAILDVITQFANTPGMSSQEAASKLAKAVKSL